MASHHKECRPHRFYVCRRADLLLQNPPDWQEILTYFRGSELQNFLTRILEDNVKAIIKPQYVDNIPKAVQGNVGEARPRSIVAALAAAGRVRAAASRAGPAEAPFQTVPCGTRRERPLSHLRTQVLDKKNERGVVDELLKDLGAPPNAQQPPCPLPPASHTAVPRAAPFCQSVPRLASHRSHAPSREKGTPTPHPVTPTSSTHCISARLYVPSPHCFSRPRRAD